MYRTRGEAIPPQIPRLELTKLEQKSNIHAPGLCQIMYCYSYSYMFSKEIMKAALVSRASHLSRAWVSIQFQTTFFTWNLRFANHLKELRKPWYDGLPRRKVWKCTDWSRISHSAWGLWTELSRKLFDRAMRTSNRERTDVFLIAIHFLYERNYLVSVFGLIWHYGDWPTTEHCTTKRR